MVTGKIAFRITEQLCCQIVCKADLPLAIGQDYPRLYYLDQPAAKTFRPNYGIHLPLLFQSGLSGRST
jgi:hypothetical protein